LIILFWNACPWRDIQKIPAPMIVLILTIPLGIFLDFNAILDTSGKPFALVNIVDFWGQWKAVFLVM